MKNFIISFAVLTTLFTFFSCNDKQLTEVVEVPLPAKDDKVIIGIPEDVKADEGAFQLAKLPYSYDALAPKIQALTLETHYSKHYLAHTNGLNKAIANTELQDFTIEEILKRLDLNNEKLRNNAGGYYNHTLYWNSIDPKGKGQPVDTLAGSIKKDFGSFAYFTSAFKNAATNQFGSGWVWLIVNKKGKLQITTTQNQDNPLMKNALVPGIPILALDMWEHSYYLDYQYKKQSYINAFYKVINWNKVNENYKAALSEIK